MKHTIVNCSSCNKKLKIKVAKGFPAPDSSMCKACSQGTPTQSVNLAHAQDHNFRAVDRAIKKRHNWTLSHKNDPTSREKASRKRIYGSD